MNIDISAYLFVIFCLFGLLLFYLLLIDFSSLFILSRIIRFIFHMYTYIYCDKVHGMAYIWTVSYYE